MKSNTDSGFCEQGTAFWCALWVELLAGCVTLCSLASIFSLMREGAMLSFFSGVAWVVFRIFQRRKTTSSTLPDADSKQGALATILAAILFMTLAASLLAGPHSFIDSYTYRFPQMLFWLQEGRPCPIPNVDMRINQMPAAWPFISASFFLTLGETAVAIPNFIGAVLLFFIFKDFAAAASGSARNASLAALILVSSPIFMMGGATNDNTVACVAMLAISLFFAMRGDGSARAIMLSGIAFALCCGIKPQYLAAAPFWALWFLFGRGRPFKIFLKKWKIAAAVVLISIICSPLPTLTYNQFYNGSAFHPKINSGICAEPQIAKNFQNASQDASHKKAYAFVNSMCRLAFQLFDIPVNPAVGKMSALIYASAERVPFLKKARIDTIQFRPMIIPEYASLGLFSAVAFIIGIIHALRKKEQGGFAALAGIVALIAATAITTPLSLGRSFIGFFLLMSPLALAGIASLSRKTLSAACVVCVASGVGIAILNPARPIWPHKTIASKIKHEGIASKIMDYGQYCIRQNGPLALLPAMPENYEGPIGLVVQNGEPITYLWKPYNFKRRIIPYPANVGHERLRRDGVEWLVIKHGALAPDGELSKEFVAAAGAEVVRETAHTGYIQKGPETWFLLNIKNAQ
jgi:hypothetical protein